jgi:drug/metabolite transporter superfamily protein YnfA
MKGRSAGDESLARKNGYMKVVVTLLLLLVAACLEVGGDAVIRAGLKGHVGSSQLSTICLGGVLLLAYGIFVNIAPADFGRSLGVYVVLFFIVAQLVNLFVFGIRPSTPILAGGAFMLVGGFIITLWKT